MEAGSLTDQVLGALAALSSPDAAFRTRAVDYLEQVRAFDITTMTGLPLPLTCTHGVANCFCMHAAQGGRRPCTAWCIGIADNASFRGGHASGLLASNTRGREWQRSE